MLDWGPDPEPEQGEHPYDPNNPDLVAPAMGKTTKVHSAHIFDGSKLQAPLFDGCKLQASFFDGKKIAGILFLMAKNCRHPCGLDNQCRGEAGLLQLECVGSSPLGGAR